MKKAIRSFFTAHNGDATFLSRVTRSLTATLSLATLLITGSAWAATPVAVWNGDFLSESGGITPKINSNTVNNDGVSVTIAGNNNSGLEIDLAEDNSFGKTVSVLFKYSNLNSDGSNRVLASIKQDDCDNIGIRAKNATLAGYYAISSSSHGNDYGNITAAIPTNGYCLLTYSIGNQDGVYGYVASVDEQGVWTWSNRFGNSSLKYTGDNRYIHSVFIGGPYSQHGYCCGFTGLTIEAVAVFNTQITTADAAAYKFPICWVGEEGANWSVAENWSEGAVPVSGDTVILYDDDVVNIDGTIASDVTIQGSGTVVYDNKLPGNEKTNYQAMAWTGSVWFKNGGTATTAVTVNFNDYGNVNSKVELTGTTLIIANTTTRIEPEIVITDDGETKGFISRGVTGSGTSVFRKVTGEGTWINYSSNNCEQRIFVEDWSGFTGQIQVSSGRGHRFVAGPLTTDYATYPMLEDALQADGKKFIVEEGNVLNICAGTSWSLPNGFFIYGTLSGAGEVQSPVTVNEGAKIKPAVGGLKFGNTIAGSVTIDCADIVAAGVNGSALIAMTGASKTLPTYTIENATGYEAFTKDGALYLVKSDAKEFYSRWENAPGILTWKSGQTITGGAKFSVFDVNACMDTTTEITDNAASSAVPGYVGTSITPWHVFVKDGKGANSYKSPGYIIRLVPVAGSTVTSLNGNFSPCNIGGLIVEEGASITSWTADGASARVGYFGDMDAQQPTWTYIGNDFTFQRSTLTFIGEVNLEIADGKTFTSTYTTSLDAAKPTILRMIGAGTFAVTAGLNASGATLDFSQQSLTRPDTFIDGGLTINEDTSFVFPSGLDPNTAYPLCTGALTAADGFYEITVGEKTALATLTFGETDGAKTVSYQWSDAKNEVTLSGDIVWNDIEWKGGSFVHNADIELTLTKDVSITFTEALTFTKPIKVLGGYTATFVCDGAIPTFVMDEEWNEIIHLKNMNFNDWDFSAYTHNGSPIKFTGVTGFGPKNTTSELTVEAILIDEGDKKAITVNNGYSDSAAYTFDKISGSGTFTFSNPTDKPPTHTYIFKNVSEFVGKFADTRGLKIVIGNGSGTGYTANEITYLADSTVKTGLGWSAPTAVFTDWMRVIGSVGDTLVTLESEPTALAMVTLLNEDGTEKDGLYQLVYEDGAVKIAVASEIVVDIANKKDMGAWTIEDPTELTGVGGVQASSLALAADAKLILDPIKTPVKLGAAPTFAAGAKLALAAAYKDCALGKFTLLTWTGAAIETEDIFDTESVSGACTLTCVDAPESGKKQLVLTVGDYANAKKIKVMPLGDSITEGTNQGQNFARPNYRIPLMQKLAANGFNVEALGYQKSCNADSAGVQANPEYEWHCGMSGQMCRTQGAAGWEDSIDVALDMAGEPDIVTFKIGTNDLRGGVQDPDVLFEAWTNVIWKILKARPATRVICGSVIDARDDQTYNTTKVVEFNAKIADFIANGDFPGGRVYFANLNAACPPRDASGNDNGNLADALHPSWIGHDKMSDCWLAKIKEVMAIPFTPEAEIVYTTTMAIEDNIPQAYRNGFVKLATYTPTATKKHTSGTALTEADYDYYAADKADTVFSKVGYYVVLKRKDTDLVDYHDHVRYLWVDMAAFGDGKLADFGVPTVKKNQQIVDALHVYSNDTGIRKVEPTDDSAKGFVEFWPFSYNDASGVEGAPAQLYGYDWNDQCTGSGAYGSMQVHRIFKPGESWNAGEVLFAYNRWTSNNNNEIGIGSFAQKMSSATVDYTKTAGLTKVDAAAYEVMSIEIWGMPVVEPVAKIGDKTYETIEAALTAAQSGETVTVLQDAQLASLTVPAGVTLDLNGKTVQVAAIENKGTIVIYDAATAVALIDTHGTIKFGALVTLDVGYTFPKDTIVTIEKIQGVPGATRSVITVPEEGILVNLAGVAAKKEMVVQFVNYKNSTILLAGAIERGSHDYDTMLNVGGCTLVGAPLIIGEDAQGMDYATYPNNKAKLVSTFIQFNDDMVSEMVGEQVYGCIQLVPEVGEILTATDLSSVIGTRLLTVNGAEIKDSFDGVLHTYTAEWIKPSIVPEEQGTVEITGEGDDAVAKITPKEGVAEIAITVPDGFSGKYEIPSTVTNVSGVAIGQLIIKSGSFDIAPACKIEANGNIVLDSTKSVTVNGEPIPVRPTLTAADDVTTPPLVVGDTTSVGVKAIPGLTYTLVRSESIGGDTTDVDSATATGARVTLTDTFAEENGGKPDSAFYVIRVTK